MEIVEIVGIGKELLKLMSKYNVRVDDWKNVKMYEEYKSMRKDGIKYRSVISELSEKYGISPSNVERTIRRLKREI